MELCHLKFFQLAKQFQKYKGRVVFRGDLIKDEEGAFALFPEHGASASSIEAARLVDIIARRPGCNGFNVDAIKAFNHVKLGADCPETWCALPRHRWPKIWEGKYAVPVVLLERNLYGHPRAGHYWEQHVSKSVRKIGFRPVPGWECLYVHPDFRCALSVYVDDFKIGGDKRNLSNVSQLLRKDIKLEEWHPLNQDVYLGMTQRDIPVPTDMVDQKRALFHKTMNVTHPTAQAPKNEDELGAAERMSNKNNAYYNRAGTVSPAKPPRIGIDVGGSLRSNTLMLMIPITSSTGTTILVVLLKVPQTPL